MARLGDICKFQSGGTPSKSEVAYFNGDIPWITTVALNGGLVSEENAIEWITEKAIKESAAKIVPANSVMVGTRVGVGKVAMNKVPMSTSQDIISLLDIDESKWSKEFICKFILGKGTYLNGQARGATIKGIKIETLAGLPLPDIPIEQQCKIAMVIDAVDNLIALRKEQLAKLNQLVKSRFIELFGDPDCNPYNWGKSTIGKVIQSCEAGWSGNGTQREKKPGEIAVLKVSAVTKGYFVPEECKVLDNQSEIKKYVFPQKGDLLFSRANTREMVGATAVILQDYPELILPDKLWKVRFVPCANVLYMKHILSHPSIRAKFSEASTGTSGSMFNVSMEKFKAIVVPLPPIERQEQFAAFVEQTDKSKLAIQQSLDKLELLKKSLMQEYFG